MQKTDSKRGGARSGSGRKPIAPLGDQVIYRLRMSQAQRDALDKLGGAAWVREQIERAEANVSATIASL